VLDVLLIGLLAWLLRVFRFGYQSPILYLLVAMLLIVVGSGFAIDHGTALHDNLLHVADRHRLPGFFGNFYEQVRHSPPPPKGHDIFRGTVASTSVNYLFVHIENLSGTSTNLYRVHLSGHETESFATGETVFIQGHISQDQIDAQHVTEALPPSSGESEI